MAEHEEDKLSPAVLAAMARRPALPGQDPGRVEEILDSLRQELSAKHVVEGIWLADIAYLTARIEFVRVSISAFQRSRLHSEAEMKGGRSTEHMLVSAFIPPPGATYLDDRAFGKLLGEVVWDHLAVIDQLDALEIRLLRERDRMIAQFERRRRSALEAAIAQVEREPGALPPPSGSGM